MVKPKKVETQKGSKSEKGFQSKSNVKISIYQETKSCPSLGALLATLSHSHSLSICACISVCLSVIKAA